MFYINSKILSDKNIFSLINMNNVLILQMNFQEITDKILVFEVKVKKIKEYQIKKNYINHINRIRQIEVEEKLLVKNQ